MPNQVSARVYFIGETEGRAGCPSPRQQGSAPLSPEMNHLNIPQEVTLDKGSLKRSWVHQERRLERSVEDSPVPLLDSIKDFGLNKFPEGVTQVDITLFQKGFNLIFFKTMF